MDAHTARCLQLSTSINPPLQQQAGSYRHNRFESMNRSRYQPQQQQQQQQPQKMPQRANSMPAVSRYPQQQQAMGQQAFKHNFQNPMMGAQFPPHMNHEVSPHASNYDGSSLFSASTNVSPNTPFGSEGQWDPTFGIDMKQMQKPQDGMGMSFLEQDVDFANPFGLNATDGTDLIHLTEQDLHDAHNPESPDRHSLSSNGSGDAVSDLPDMTGGDASMLSQDIPMATVEEDEPIDNFGRPGRSHTVGHSRSNSRAPAARASSTRRYRRAPYNFDGHRRSSSVMSAASSVGSVAPMSMPPTQCCSPVNECHDDFGQLDFGQLDFGSARPSVDADLFAMDPMAAMPHGPFPSDLIAPQPKYVADQMFLQHGFAQDPLFEAHAPILPSSHVPELAHHKVDEFAEYAEEPDLFGALSEEASIPSEEDMNPADESMKPQEQETRFEGDLYTPRYVRGTGVNREGYCGLCKPGRWLVLKNSAYWYDKSFTHGISAATGQPFDGPKETRRMSGNPDVWEGLCGCCNEWIALISNKKKGTTWFRHAYKCHNHNKNKDSKKKNAKKNAKADKEASPEQQPAKAESEQPAPPQQQQQPPPNFAQQFAEQQHQQQQQAFHAMSMPPQHQGMQAIGSFF